MCLDSVWKKAQIPWNSWRERASLDLANVAVAVTHSHFNMIDKATLLIFGLAIGQALAGVCTKDCGTANANEMEADNTKLNETQSEYYQDYEVEHPEFSWYTSEELEHPEFSWPKSGGSGKPGHVEDTKSDYYQEYVEEHPQFSWYESAELEHPEFSWYNDYDEHPEFSWTQSIPEDQLESTMIDGKILFIIYYCHFKKYLFLATNTITQIYNSIEFEELNVFSSFAGQTGPSDRNDTIEIDEDENTVEVGYEESSYGAEFYVIVVASTIGSILLCGGVILIVVKRKRKTRPSNEMELKEKV